ncbi:LysR family transcriptional regulator [Aquabacter spiritensis]|jgi:DNA-binding transcriptional LysR family regulator|uniref:LysR family transcriptional regulator n=1 Tax=Aquabacter spiritensis TaxID=933073 RepID=A0A4R3LUE5_9HYPH|nr:LysR family transcriptional regulator [Aquabacter spiritensis]MBA4788671.1 LysR family transcriptional regulator [Hyphomicrobiales bacterium]TCT03626.1 LysR family transcriptional regulator [Aquabacter spiritensis]
MVVPLSPSIELRHLRYFAVAAEHGSFRKAGAALDVKESSISRSIRDLEDEIGVSLFIRHSGGVNLTLAGQRYLSRTRQALEQIREAGEEAAAFGRAEEGLLRIGLFSRLASGFLAGLFDSYDQRYSGVHIDFVEAPAESHAAAIRRFDLDAAFVLGRQSWADCDAIPLWSEPLFFALPRLHRLAHIAALSWRDLIDETFLVRTQGSGNEVRGFLERKFRELDISPRISTQQLARYSLFGLVASGRGILPVLESETSINLPEVVYRPLIGEVIPFSVIYSPKNDNPAVRTLLSLTRKMAHERAATR